jgi:putative restriction endonuclease
MERIFGEQPGWIEGSHFQDRKSLAEVGIHPPRVAGISYSESEGADSVVLSGGYADDEDQGDIIIYTGMGGRDPATTKQVRDQDFDRGNKALGINKNEGLPVRVTRGSDHKSPHSPVTGYTYAGLYRVDDYWHDRGVHGFLVWRFRLVKIHPLPATAESPQTTTATEPSKTVRQSATVLRIVRDTEVARGVKRKHQHLCQVCGSRIDTPAGPYAEAAHIRPLGRPHNGPDIAENILCLCPNHHVMFDSGTFGVADDLTLLRLVGTLRTSPGHTIGLAYLQYHREHYGLV